MKLSMEKHPQGVVLSITAQPGSRRNEVRCAADDGVKVCVTQIPEKGKANKIILEQLADFLKVRKSQLELLAGETSRQKKVLIRGVTAEELSAKISEKLQ